MEDAHYVVLFAGLIFGKNPAANDRSGVAIVRSALEVLAAPDQPVLVKRGKCLWDLQTHRRCYFVGHLRAIPGSDSFAAISPLHHLCARKRATWACNAARE